MGIKIFNRDKQFFFGQIEDLEGGLSLTNKLFGEKHHSFLNFLQDLYETELKV